MAKIPNLKAMSEDELMTFWSRYHRATRNDAEELVGDRRPLFTVYAAKLANYACNRATMLACKRRGDELAAGVYLHSMNLCHDDLPADLKAEIDRY